VGYGFADGLGKSGEDLYMSVLFWESATQLQLAALHTRAAAASSGDGKATHLAAAVHFQQRAGAV
jgi:hypothetical protein